jgi:hypothetical protein
VFFDTCVYHQPGIDLLTRVIPVGNVLFASEMIGAVRGVDPETGFNYDDTRRYIDASTQLTPVQKNQISKTMRRISTIGCALKEGAMACTNWGGETQHSARGSCCGREAGSLARNRARSDGPPCNETLHASVYAGAFDFGPR